MLQKVNIVEKLGLFQEHWSPKIVGEVENCQVKLVKFQGEFVWHSHADEDEMFLVVAGSFVMKLRDGDIPLSAGEFLIVPKGTEHMPVAEEEVHVLLFEPSTTLNTGNAVSDKSVAELERI